MTTMLCAILVGVFVGGVGVRDAEACDPDTAGMQRLLDGLEKALKAGDEAVFRAGWHSKGYDKNLVGGSGLSGREVFAQGHRKQWYLKGHLSKMRSAPEGPRCGPWIVPVDIWSWKQDKALDRVEALIAWQEDGWKLIGAGERAAEVEALAKRWVGKAPLAPPESD